MKYLLIICQCVFWFQWMSTTQLCVAENSKPNVVLIMVDDMGYGDRDVTTALQRSPLPFLTHWLKRECDLLMHMLLDLFVICLDTVC